MAGLEVEEGQARDQPALGVGEEVDRHARLVVGHGLDQVGQAAPADIRRSRPVAAGP